MLVQQFSPSEFPQRKTGDAVQPFLHNAGVFDGYIHILSPLPGYWLRAEPPAASRFAFLPRQAYQPPGLGQFIPGNTSRMPYRSVRGRLWQFHYTGTQWLNSSLRLAPAPLK